MKRRFFSGHSPKAPAHYYKGLWIKNIRNLHFKDSITGNILEFSLWEKNRKYGIVAEAHGHIDQKALEETLKWKIREMAKIREIEIGKINYQTETLKVPANNYGCVIATLIYIL